MTRVTPTTEPDALTLRQPSSSAPRESRFVRRRLFALLHVGILLCLLLPFVTLGASCSEMRTEPLTGYELVSGKQPVIVNAGSADNGYYAGSGDVEEIQDRYDVARTGAISLFALSLLALVVVIRPYRETAKASIAFTLLSLVALAVILQPSAEAGAAHVGLGLAYLFVLATLFADVFVFRRVGGRVSPAGVVVLVLGIPASQCIGIALGSALGP